MLFRKSIVLLSAVIYPLMAQAKLNIVATIPDFGAIAEEIGGDEVKVTSLAKGTEDAHFIDAKPSYIRLLNQADVLLEGGADLEVGWLPSLINSARNAKILPEGAGRVNMSEGLRLLDIPTGPIDRSMGDVHPLGNPHFWLDPANGKIMAEHIAHILSNVDAKNATLYAANLKKFNQRLDTKIAEWTKRMEPFRGMKIVTYHKSFDYFAERFGLQVVGQLEPKPGLEPSPTYINTLIPKLKSEGVKIVMIEPFRPRKAPEYVAKSIGAKVVLMPDKVGAQEKVKDYISLFDYAVEQFTAAVKE